MPRRNLNATERGKVQLPSRPRSRKRWKKKYERRKAEMQAFMKKEAEEEDAA